MKYLSKKVKPAFMVLTLALCTLLCGFSTGLMAEQPPPMPDDSQIPEEFRDLAAPQVTVADFYYGGRRITSATIIYTPATITISDPEGLVNLIPNIAKPQSVTAALTGEVSSNPAKVCGSSPSDSCGRLTPEVAGVIFDPYRFRVDLFIAEPYLETVVVQQSKFLPPSSSDLGLIQGFSAAASGTSGTDADDDTYSVFGNTLIGWRENHLVSDWDHTDDNDFSVDTLYLERDTEGTQMGAGYLDYSNSFGTSEFASSKQVLGLRLGSSMNSRQDVANVNSTPIRIFVSGRSRVEVLHDNRLIYATTVEAGSQEIDTRSFPQGSYNVTIRIYEGSALIQELTRFYSKSIDLPPADEMLWYLEGGEMSTRTDGDVMPESMNEWVLRGGLSRRIAENAALSFHGTGTDQEQTLETELFYLGSGWEASTTAMVGNNSAKGLAFESNFDVGPVSVSYYHRRLWNDNYEGNIDETSENDTFEDDALILDEGFESRSLSLSSAFMGGNLSGSYSYNDQDNSSESETIYSLNWYKNLFTFSGHDLDIELDYSESDDDKIGTVGLTLRRNTRNWNYSIKGQSRWEKEDGESSENVNGYNVDSRWYDNEFGNGTAELGLAVEDLDETERVITGDVRLEQARYLAEGTVGYIEPDTEDSYTSYTGRFDTSFAINTDGAAIRGGNSEDSALMVEIGGSSKAYFNVIINGSAVATARGGSTTVVPMAPYGTYQVGIKPRGENFFNYDQSIREVTLYPGNVETVTFEASEVLMLLGQLLDEAGKAIESAIITGDDGRVRTDQFGIFQVRIPATETRLRATLSENRECYADIPEDYSTRRGVGLVGALICK